MLNFDFEGGRYIEKTTIAHAKELNKQFPFFKKKQPIISDAKNNDEITVISNPKTVVKIGDPDSFLLNIYKTKAFRGTFTQIFSNSVYNKILNDAKKSNFHPNRDIYASIAVVRMMQIAQKSQKHVDSFINWLGDFKNFPDYTDSNVSGKFENSLKKFFTGRIDLKNFGGQNNSVEVLSFSDKTAKIDYPGWFKNNQGAGMIFRSTAGICDIKVKCIGNGELKIYLRGLDFRDKNGIRLPIYIDFTTFIVEGKTILKESKLVWYDKPFIFNKNVTNGEIVKLHAEWKPFDNQSVV